VDFTIHCTLGPVSVDVSVSVSVNIDGNVLESDALGPVSVDVSVSVNVDGNVLGSDAFAFCNHFGTKFTANVP